MIKALASILFGMLTVTVVLALRTAPFDSSWFMPPDILIAVLATVFMGVLLEVWKPSK